jgi:RNase H-fold protein (predicted Holliday junction resolvase)
MSPEKIKDSLIQLGYKLADRGSYWQTNAIFRNGDNKTAIQIYKNTGVWKDHVQDSTFSPFSRLVEITLGTNDKNRLKQFLDEDDLGDNYNRLTNSEKLEMEEIYNENCLDRLLPHYKFYNDRGISEKTLKSLKGGYATTGKLYGRFVFPIYNEHKQIHGFSGRDMNSSGDRPKWKHVGRKTGWIYPLYANPEVEQAINETQSVILVESIGDLLNLNEHGYKNVLVTFGLDVSTKLICATLSLNINKIVLSLNNDKTSSENRGLNASIKNYLKLLNYYNPEKILICLPTEKDFGDMSDDQFKQWTNKLQSLTHEKQKPFILDKINSIQNKLPKTLLKNKKILINE